MDVENITCFSYGCKGHMARDCSNMQVYMGKHYDDNWWEHSNKSSDPQKDLEIEAYYHDQFIVEEKERGRPLKKNHAV